jgi:hypothetical protein
MIRFFVMAGLVPAIHVFLQTAAKAWMPGTSPGMTSFTIKPVLVAAFRLFAPIRTVPPGLLYSYNGKVRRLPSRRVATGSKP